MAYQLKTKPNHGDPQKFLATIDNEQRKKECQLVMQMMQQITKQPATMWGASLIGFGSYSYTYKSGHSGSWMVTGLSPRKANLTIYIMNGFSTYEKILSQLGKHKLSKSCLYLKTLDDIKLPVLRQLIKQSVHDMSIIYPNK